MTRVAAALVLFAAAFLGTSPGEADAAACIRRSGQLVIRAACRPAERPFAAEELSPVGPVGPGGAPGAAARFPLAILDAGGQELGPVLSFDAGLAVVLVTHPALPAPTPFATNPAGLTNFYDEDRPGVLYSEPNCAGTPHLAALNASGYAQVHGTAAYAPDGDAREITVQSVEVVPTGFCFLTQLTGRGTCCVAETRSESARPAARVGLDQLGFTPPLRAVPAEGVAR